MAKKIEDLSVLLIQLRRDHWQRIEQQECFLKYSGLGKDQFVCVNAFSETIPPDIAQGYDAVIIGGSAEYNVSRREPAHLDDLAELVRLCEREAIPLLGICYGAHVIAYALGGIVEYAPHRKELGTYMIHTRPEYAADDVLFADTPADFKANIGRTDDIIELPMDAVSLASSDMIEHHAFTIAEKPIYGVQFHPELDREQLLSRFAAAYEFGGYFDSHEEYERLSYGVEDTPEAAALLKKFFERVVI